MNKLNVVELDKKSTDLVKPLNEVSLSQSSCSESETSDDDDVNDDDDDDYMSNSQVVGLFSDKTFKNVQDLFKHEFEVNKFNLVDILRKNNMGMIEYIKMINYIRKEVFI